MSRRHALVSPSAAKRRLPCIGKVMHSELHAFPERLYPLISPPNTSLSRGWYLDEAVVRHEAPILIVEGAVFRRYVWGLQCLSRPDGTVTHVQPTLGLAGLDVFKPKHKQAPLVSRIFVMPEFRRQGIATRLLERAMRDFPKLALDGQLTREGAAFFGYQLKG
jgi:GNAT superfamily N-acetyltransferase